MSGREPIMQALFALLTSSIASTFTGTTAYGSPVITGIPSTAGLFVGLPVTSPRTPSAATILSVDSATQVTRSEAATSAGSSVSFTTGFRTASRRLKLWTDVATQPALFLRSDSEDIAPRAARMPAKATMRCEAWVYSKAGAAPDAVPAATLNYILDAIMRVLEPEPVREVQTLGGLVHHCWIEGQIELHTGDLDGQAIAVVPINILVPISQ
jgi:hypothetical protein